MLGGMNSSEGTLLANPPHLRRLPALAIRRVDPEPVALVLLAGTLGFWDLARNGWANSYYSAAIRSMSSSWNDFLFVSLDPSGVMSVDKPPLALWVQTLSVKVFGFHPLAILAPQVLMGVASVLLLYDITRRVFGRRSGFVAGLVLALTPIAVAISRHNNPDALLVLCCVLALWCALRASESDRLRWYVLAGVCVGLGFETKMLVALVVLPGMLAAWAWARPRPTQRHALWRGPMAAVLALVLVAGAWPALVELTPASRRPWVSGTSDNRVLSLIFGYNGLGRVEGQSGGPPAALGARTAGAGLATTGGAMTFGGRTPGGSDLFGGTPGPLRLLNSALGGQAGWMLGFALLGGVAVLLACRLRRRDPRSGWLLCVGGAFLTTALLFSFARGIFHPYYVSLLAPFSAALVGAGFGQLTAGRVPGESAAHETKSMEHETRYAGRETPSAAHETASALHERAVVPALAAIAVAAGVATELVVLHDYPGELAWLEPTLIVSGALAVGLLLIGGARLRLAVLSCSLALLIVAPATWAVDTLGHATSGTFPAGGPADNLAGTPGGLGRGPSGFAGPPGGFAGAGVGGPRGAPGGFAGPPSGGSQGAPAAGALAGPSQPPAAAADERGAFNSESPAARARPGGANQLPRTRGGLENGTPGGPAGRTLRETVRYTKAHGGGTVAVSSQSEAAPLVIDGADVAGIGGFSGRESETTAAWLAQEVRTGRIRWVMANGGFGGAMGGTPSAAPGMLLGGVQGTPFGEVTSAPFGGGPGAPFGGTQRGGLGGSDARRGASAALSAAASDCRAVSSVSGLYDCAGRAAKLAGAARD
jgi:4-amino-4-deoxy-L-arabinose transferase-like glycosyltransferase